MRSIIAFSWLLLVLFSGGGWYLYSASFGVSVVAGGVLANVSFLLLKKDLEGLFTKVSQAGGAAAAVSQTEKIRFFIKFYARLVILGLLLILLVSKFSIHMIGLSLGLATVMLSVIVVVLSRGRSFYSVQSLRSV
ncbi:ATP synthase subunit I [Desulfogranum mediterraneum]|uniref:ATP synthase subunit I n=1 Tax=Desulfogranum mediterraneum TaxID=160661 RepID=UPI001ABFB22C|nr:ATP synthase subunit I [Desulfogranum mediterraneum]